MRNKAAEIKQYIRTGLFWSSLSCLSISASVHAQPANTTIEEVVVTAQKRETSLQETPISITAFSASQLEDQLVTKVSDITRSVPNVKFNHGRDTSSEATVHIRGVGQSDEQGAPGVGIYVDDVFLARPNGSLFDLNNVERIEVLRGPQGTLFGRNTIGGAIHVITRKPSSDFDYQAELGVGSFGGVHARGSVNVPVSDRLYSRISLLTSNHDGWVRDVNQQAFSRDDLNAQDSQAVRLQLRYRPSDSLTVDFSYDNTRGQSTTPAIHLMDVLPNTNGILGLINGAPELSAPGPFESFVVGDPREINLNQDTLDDLDVSGGSFVFDWTLANGVGFKSITAYREFDNRISIDLDGTPLRVFDQRSFLEQEQSTQEFQLTGDTERLDWVVGVFYFDEKNIFDTNVGIFLGDTPSLEFSFDRTVTQDTTSYAVYGNATYRIADALSATAGIRYTDEKLDFDIVRTPLVSQVTFSGSPSTDFTSATPKLGIEYRWNEDMFGYGSVSQGFKAGGFNTRASTDGALEDFDPEEATSYEVGFKSNWLNDRLLFNSSVYYVDYQNIQLQTFFVAGTGDLVSSVNNAGEAVVQGVEMELTYLPVRGLEINASVGLTDAEFKEYEDAELGDLSFRKFQDTPEEQYFFAAQYSWPLNGGGGLLLGADYSYQSEVFHDPANNEEIAEDGYGLFNARLKWTNAAGNMDITAFVKNITDEEYLVSGVDFSELDYFLGYFGPPRTWGLSISVRGD